MLIIQEGDSVRVSGVNYGTGSTLQIERRIGRFLILRAGAGKHWVGRGMPMAYHGPSWHLFEISEEGTEDGRTMYIAEERFSIDVGRKRKASLAEVVRRAEDLDKAPRREG